MATADCARDRRTSLPRTQAYQIVARGGEVVSGPEMATTQGSSASRTHRGYPIHRSVERRDLSDPVLSSHATRCKPRQWSARVPWPDTRDAVDGDVDDGASGRIIERWELHVGTEVSVRELLEQLGSTAFGDPGIAVDDQVLLEPWWLHLGPLHREHHAGVAADVPELPPRAEVAEDDLVIVQPDPHHR